MPDFRHYRGAEIEDAPCGSISPSALQPVIIDTPITARMTNANFFMTFSFARYAGRQVVINDPYNAFHDATSVPNVATPSSRLHADEESTV